MSRDLTNKQRWVLEHFAGLERPTALKEVSSASPRRTGKSGDRTYEYPSLMYEQVYVAAEQLRKRGLVDRQPALDRWGDVVGGRVEYFITEQGRRFLEHVADDPLERMYRSPSAEVDR